MPASFGGLSPTPAGLLNWQVSSLFLPGFADLFPAKRDFCLSFLDGAVRSTPFSLLMLAAGVVSFFQEVH